MKWWKNDEPKPLNILARRGSMVGWGKFPHGQKKELSNVFKQFPTSRRTFR
jgi:hypothetical protein